jgi:hypothetical protein
VLAGCVVTFLVASLAAQRPESNREARPPGLDPPLLPGWQLLTYNRCRIAVPAAWHSESDGSLLLSTDGSSISMRMARMSDWTAHKAQIKAAFGQVNVVHEDDDQRIWLEIGANPRIQHYVAVPSGTNAVCSAILQLRPSTSTVDDTVRRIAQSIGPVPDSWPHTVR